MSLDTTVRPVDPACAAAREAIATHAIRPLPMPGTLLVHMGDEATPDAFSEAVRLAERSGAALLAVAAEGFFAEAWGIEPVPGAYLAGSLADYRERLDATEPRFRKEAAALGERARWVREEDFPHLALARHACGADWVIARRPEETEGNLYAPPLTDLIMGTGLPVLLLGDEADPLEARRVVVGWRDSRESRRAVADAMPFLQAADEVILTIADDYARLEDRPDVEDVRRRLAERGCKVSVLRQPVIHGGVAATLAHVAAEKGADLIVVGGYAHSRLREWVLGGVTRDLIRACAFHVLFSH